jgi:RNA polymerase sigma-70 factor (ECF subfamily)
MFDRRAFDDLVRRVREGDHAAAAEFVSQYQVELLRWIHFQLIRQGAQRRGYDSLDIFQSVCLQFWLRVSIGAVDLRSPESVLALLKQMLRQKIIDKRRKPSERYEQPASEEQLDGVPGSEAPPTGIVADEDLLQQVRRRLTEANRQLLELRMQGCPWVTIAAQLGGEPEALRKQLKRALARTGAQLHLDPENQSHD